MEKNWDRKYKKLRSNFEEIITRTVYTRVIQYFLLKFSKLTLSCKYYIKGEESAMYILTRIILIECNIRPQFNAYYTSSSVDRNHACNSSRPRDSENEYP